MTNLEFKIEKERQLIALNSDAVRTSVVEHESTQEIEQYASEKGLHVFNPFEGFENEYKYFSVSFPDSGHRIEVRSKEKWKKEVTLISY